jgi:hypothetical protein
VRLIQGNDIDTRWQDKFPRLKLLSIYVLLIRMPLCRREVCWYQGRPCTLACFGEDNLDALKRVLQDSEIAIKARYLSCEVIDWRCRYKDPGWREVEDDLWSHNTTQERWEDAQKKATTLLKCRLDLIMTEELLALMKRKVSPGASWGCCTFGYYGPKSLDYPR